MSRLVAAALSVGLMAAAGSVAAVAQQSVPPNQVTPFKDTSMLKPPAGARVAIVEWEDMECPACAHAFPIVHEALAKYHIPLVRHDFLIGSHIWSREASIYARYLQDKVSPDLATEYRKEVFASQYRIGSKDDLRNFTQKFMSSHGQQMPFVVDPTGQFAREVEADKATGDKLGLQETPTIVVVTQHGWIQVKDVSQLYTAIDKAEAMAGSSAPAAPAKKAPSKAAAHK